MANLSKKKNPTGTIDQGIFVEINNEKLNTENVSRTQIKTNA